MEGIFLGQVKDGVFSADKTTLTFNHECDIHELHPVIRYSDCDYMLVKADDVIKTNDELLKLRDECKELRAWYSKVNNELFQKCHAYNTLEEAYKNEKITGEMLLKDRDALREKVEKLDAELTEIKTARTLREAYVKGVEQGCESLREERDRWKRRFHSVTTDFTNSLSANGIDFVMNGFDRDGNWDVSIDIPELIEAKKKIEDLEKELADAKSNVSFWKGRKEEMEEGFRFWCHTYDRVVKKAAEKGIHIDVRGTDADCNAGEVVVDNAKASELLADKFELEKINQNFRKRINAADARIKYLESQVNQMEALKEKLAKRWSAMMEALKEKGVEASYKGEEDGKPIIDIKIPGWESDKEWLEVFAKKVCDLRADTFGLEEERDALKAELDDLKKEHSRIRGEFGLSRKQAEYDHKRLEELKSNKVATCTMEVGADGGLKFIYTYMDGHTEAARIYGPASDAESISCGTIPKCSSCSHYMYNHRYNHRWCYKLSSPEGPGTIRRLSKEEADGPACSDFKAKE